MPEKHEFPAQQPPEFGNPDAVEMSSPEFQAMKEELKKELRAENPKAPINEGLLDHLAHVKFITKGLDIEAEKRREKFRHQA